MRGKRPVDMVPIAVPRMVPALLIVALVVAACGTASPTAQSPAAATPTSQPSEPIGSPVETPAEPTKVRIGVAGTFLPLAPLWIAESQGFFEEEGLDVEIFVAPSLQGIAGLLSGDLQFYAGGATDIMVAHEQGQPMIGVASIEPRLELHFYARNDVLEERGVTPESPLQDKLAAMKGMTISVTGVGGAANQALNMMVREAGLQETDVNVVPIAGQGAQLAALLEGQIDGIVGGPPLSDQVEVGGLGSILVRGYEIPVMSDLIYEAMYTTPELAEADAEVTRAVVRSIANANQYLRESPDAPQHMHDTNWNTTSVEILTLSLNRLRDQYPADACFTSGQAEGLMEYGLAVGILSNPIDTSEGVFWTNEYAECD